MKSKVIIIGIFYVISTGPLLAQLRTLAPKQEVEYDKYGRKIVKEPPYSKKIDRKTFITPHLGVGIFPSNQTLDRFGRSENIYAGFTPSLHTGMGVYYILWKERFSVGGDINLLYASKRNYRMFAGGAHLGVRYSLFPDKHKISPYAFLGMSYYVINLTQDTYSKTFDSKNSDLFPFGENTSFTNNYPGFNITYGPVSGAFVGAGVEFKIDRKFKVFMQAAYYPTIGYNQTLQENVSENAAFLSFTQIQGGFNIRLMKPKPPEIDTNTIFIPDLIAELEVPEDHMQGRLLVRENVFDVILREGMKHDVRISNGDHEIIIDEEVEEPCKVVCYLFNDKGEMVSSAQSSPDGRVIFSDVEKGVYDLSFVLEKPCASASFKYAFPSPDDQIILQHNNEGTITDSMTYNIEGRIDIPDTTAFDFIYNPSELFLGKSIADENKNFDVEVLLAEADGKILKHYTPGHDERFSFKGLPPGNYEVLFKVPDAELHTGVNYAIFDNYKHPVSNKSTTSECDSILQAREDHIKYKLKGKIDLTDSTIKPENVMIYLVNCYKKIVACKRPEKDGSFSFGNLHADEGYSVFYELSDPMKRLNMLWRIERPAAPQPATIEKIILSDMSVWNTNTEYDIKGNIIYPKGYAVMVSASDNIDRVNYLCKHLREDGFGPIAIQVQGTSNLNKRFAFSKDFKLFKILIGAFNTEKEAIQEKMKLDFFGYDAFVVKHLEQ